MKKKIIVADDDKDIVVVLTMMLEDAGYEVSSTPFLRQVSKRTV